MPDRPTRRAAAAKSAKVAVLLHDRAWRRLLPAPVRQARRAALAALAAVPGAAGEATVVLADDAAVQALNRDYRGKDKPTNVLSFPLDPAGGLLGDVILARQTLAREATEQGKTPADHLAHLVVHGVLHLLGHDHEREPEARRMEALEVRILAGLGIADPYRGETRGAA